MNTFTAMEIISTGLAAQRTRLNVTASNLANAQTTRTAEGGPYKRKDPVFQSEALGDKFRELLSDQMSEKMHGVRTVEIVEDTAPPRMVHNPGHPDADENGFVAYPNITVVEEMVNMIMASRAYDAGTTAINSITSMAQSALKIGS